MGARGEQRALSLASAAGNAFHLWDGFAAAPPEDAAALAVELCRASGRDGLLLALPDPEADARMVLYNADGSRAETCGNGLRCVGKLVGERTGAARLSVRTDAGPSEVELFRAGQRVVSARTSLGRPRALERAGLEVAGEILDATFVDLGNPHCVVLGAAELLGRLPELGPLLERHPRFPARANVELGHVTGGALRVRVWERGVGETRACGSGACAAALAAVERGLAVWPVAVEMPGGRLEVDGAGPELRLSGPVEG